MRNIKDDVALYIEINVIIIYNANIVRLQIRLVRVTQTTISFELKVGLNLENYTFWQKCVESISIYFNMLKKYESK